MPENDIKKPKHLMIIRLSALGDVAMTVPVVLALRQQYPALKITVVSRPFFSHFFAGIPDVDFVGIDFNKYKSGLPGLYEVYKDLSRVGIDAYADLHDVLRTKVIKFLFKWNKVSVVSLDKGRRARKQLTALKPKTIRPIKSILTRHTEVCEKLNLPIDLSQISLLDKGQISDSIVKYTGDKKSIWIGIAPFATYATKMYPLDLMEQVIKQLEKENLKVLLFGGGEKEIEKLETLATASKNSINMAGKLSFDRELTLISNLDLMLSMDSGNGHLAAMYGVPVITMWGNTHPYAGFIPFNQPLSNSLVPDLKTYPFLPTSIYGNKIIDNYEDCMKSISPESVVEKIKSLLGV